MKKITILLSLCSGLLMAQTVTYEVTITNLTKSQIMSPPVVVAHGDDYRLFTLGGQASEELATMAEDGIGGGIVDAAMAHADVSAAVISDGPLLPGASVTLEVESTSGVTYITAAGMLVTTNDAFFAVNGILAPRLLFKNAYTLDVVALAEAYDAGSEANTENCSDIPGPPCGNGGVRVTDGAEGYIYIHSGVHGIGDINAASYDWRSKVARVSISVK